ncbi:hypothetical protein NQ315_002054 [Exocentrus adspersus]|uniref:Endonuclease/exonuclease/phosphatase domain-containing protein n=1 Tax=Exocentrus adspersus TaxID=1586481 RepID=A0AAV8VFU8_9CUCU|nr:hypothetical protein NQ315_002054 [Exocentrus adspersus]
MLINTILGSLRDWSSVLRRIVEISYIFEATILKSSSKVNFKNMSKKYDTDKYNSMISTGHPSTSGSINNNWNSSFSGVDNHTIYQQSNGNNETRTQEYVFNVVRPLEYFQGISPHFYQPNYCHYMGEHFSESMRYYQTSELYQRHQRVEGVEKRGKTKSQSVLSLRNWENVYKNKKPNTKPGFIFTLMCYNVLAQDLLSKHPYLYNRHDKEHLAWNVRWNNIIQEITKYKPDILCLQEVQESHVSNYFSVLETIGYSGVYKKRTGERTDGCALYYKTDIIHLVEHTSVEYFQPNIAILNRDNVGLIAKFSPKLHPSKEFVVATTHLLYNPRRQDVRLAQVQLLLTELERISYNSSLESNYLPIILTGDLNSTPDSPVYEFITKGKLKYDILSPRSLKKDSNMFTGKILIPAELRITDNCQHANLLEKRKKNASLSRSEEVSAIDLFHSERDFKMEDENKKIDSKLFSTGTLSHNFAFKSVYCHGNPPNNEGTTFQGQWMTVDYIFYSTKKQDVHSEDKLKLLSRYRLPTKEELQGVIVPNSVLGSDHLSLLAKFKLEY